MDVVTMLQKIGFSEYEAQVYIHLLKMPGQNGTQISKDTKMPRTTVYNALDQLYQKQYIDLIPTIDDKKNYIPLEPNQIILKLQKEYKMIFDNIGIELEKIYNPLKFSQIYNIFGEENIYEKINDLIINAKQSIIIMGNIDESKLKKVDIIPKWIDSNITKILIDNEYLMIINFDDVIKNAIFTNNELVIRGLK